MLFMLDQPITACLVFLSAADALICIVDVYYKLGGASPAIGLVPSPALSVASISSLQHGV